MKALRARSFGGPEVLSLDDVPDPEAGPEEVLVRVSASALNRADILQRRGHYPPPPGVVDTLGLELAGVAVDTGERVMALLPGGGQAEFAAVPRGFLMPIPANLSFEQAAAIPEVFITAYNALIPLGGLTAGKSVLIHAGASGLGTAAIQIAKDLGARIFTTAGSPEKAAACRALGAEGVILRGREDLAEKVLDWTSGRGVDVILDVAGASAAAAHAECAATEARWIVLGFLGGRRVRDLDLSRVLFKRLRIEGSALRPKPSPDKFRLVADFAAWALPRFADGRLKPVVDRVFPWTQAADAHRYMEENRNVGKIVLRMEF
jgi:tumor protein p53-inducible protein 3